MPLADGATFAGYTIVRLLGSRGRRADEQLEVMRLLSEDRPDGASFRGEFVGFDNAMCYPKPAGRVPIHIGGHSPTAARRAGRLGDGFQQLGVGGAELTELVAVMRDDASQFGRDLDALELFLGHLVTKIDADRAKKLAALGADRVVLAMPPTADLSEARELLSACAQRLSLTS
jgi:alkanesulfonate monooxygenase SsuD/methylene tetrahydromethanopterin reductase-like flavin-dependent oxidoreductase (luciferase family)